MVVRSGIRASRDRAKREAYFMRRRGGVGVGAVISRSDVGIHFFMRLHLFR